MHNEMTKEGEMNHGPHMHDGHHHRPWQNNWKSPVSLGIFLSTVALALVLLMYAANLAGAIVEAMHPAASQGMSQQELQQLMQQAPAQSGAAATGAGQ